MCLSNTSSIPIPQYLNEDAQEVFDRIRAAWCAETSYFRQEVDRHDRGKGQSAATALLVQDYFNGTIMHTVDGGVGHYWNRINGTEIDLTRSGIINVGKSYIHQRSRETMLEIPDVKRRYEILKRRVEG